MFAVKPLDDQVHLPTSLFTTPKAFGRYGFSFLLLLKIRARSTKFHFAQIGFILKEKRYVLQPQSVGSCPLPILTLARFLFT